MRSRIVSALAILAAALAAPIAPAQTIWDGGGTDVTNRNWSYAFNWNNDTVAGNSSAFTLHMAGVVKNTPIVDAPWGTVGLAFDNTALTQFKVTGSALSIGANGITNNSVYSQQIDNNIVLTAGQTWTTTTAGNLAVTGGITNGGNTLQTNALLGSTITLSGNIGGGGGITTTTGGGTTVLSGNNSYTGINTIGSGTVLRATTNASALGASSAANAVALAGGTLQLGSNAGLSFGRNTTVSANSSIVSDRQDYLGLGVTNSLGTLSIGAQTLNVDAGSNVLGNASTTSPAAVSFGATTLTGNATFDVGSNAKLTVGAIADGSVARTVTKADSGTLVFGANATTATAGSNLVINGGVAEVAAATALGTGAYNVTVNSTTTSGTANFNLNGVNQTIGSLTFGGTGAGANAVNSVTTGANTLTLGGNVTYTNTNNPGGATITGNLALGANRTFTIGDSSNTAAELTVGATISGSGFGINKQGAGTLVLSGANTYTGVTTATAGTLRAESNAAALGTGAATLTLAGGTLQLANDTGLNFGRNTTVSSNSSIVSDRLNAGAGVTHTLGTLAMGTQTLNVDAGSNASGTAGITFGATSLTGNPTFDVGPNAQLNLGALQTNASARTITKADTGTLNFNAAATSVTAGSSLLINGGVAQVSNATALGSGATNVTVNATTASGTANFNLNGANQTIGSLTFGGTGAGANAVNSVTTGGNTLTLGGNVTYTSTNNPGGATITGNLALGANRTFTIGDSSNTAAELTVGATISGSAFGINKQGTGTLVLNGANSYTGVNTATAGILRAESTTTALGTGAATLTLAGGTVQLASDNGLNFGRNTTVSANSTLTSDRVNAGTGVNQTLGTLSIGAQTLNVTAGANVSGGTAGVTFGATTLTASTATFDVGSNANLTLGALSGNFNFAKQGAGQLTMGGTGTRSSGSTTLTAGTLSLTNTAGLGTTGTTLSLNGGTLDLSTNSTVNAYNTTIGGNTSIVSNRLSAGAGVTQTLGTLSIGGQTLNVDAGNNVISGTGTVAFGATTLTGNPTFDVGAGAQLTIGALTTGAARNITKTDAGTLTFGTAATSVTSGTNLIVNAGVAQVSNATALGSGATNVTVNATAASGTANFNLTTAQTIGSLTFGGSGAGANATNTVTSAGNTLTLGGNVTYDATNNPGAATLSGTLALGANRTFTIGDSTSTTNELTISANIATGAFGINKQGAGTLTLSGNNSNTGTTTLTAGTLNLNSAGALPTSATLALNGGTLDSNGSAAVTITGTPAISVGGTVTFTGTQSLNLGTGAVNLGGAARTFNVGANTLTLGGAVSNGGLTKTGNGTLLLSSANSTYTGVTTVSAGVLEVKSLANGTSNSSIGNPGNTNASQLVLDGGTLRYSGTSNVTTNRNFTLNATGGTIENSSASNTLGFTSTSAITMNGSGNRTLTLGGNSTGLSTLAMPIANPGSGSTALMKTGTGAWTLNTTGSTMNGGITIAGGTLTQGTATFTNATPNAMTFTGTGAFARTNNGTTEDFGALAINAGDATLTSVRTSGTTLTTFTSFTRAAGATVLFGYVSGDHSNSHRFSLAGVSAGFVDQGTFARDSTANLSASFGYYVTGGNSLIRPIAYGSDANAVTMGTAATVGANTDKYLQITGAITAQTTSVTEKTLEIYNASNFTLTNSAGTSAVLTLTNGGLLKGGNAGAASSATLTSEAAGGIQANTNQELSIRADRTFDTLIVDAPIRANGSNALTISGAGTVQLGSAVAGSNTYTGLTTVNSGLLLLSKPSSTIAIPGDLTIQGGTVRIGVAGNQIADTSAITFGNGGIGTAVPTFDVNGISETVASIAGTNASSVVALGAGNLTLGGSSNTSYAGVISGAGTLTKAGSGTLTLSGASTMTGNMNVTGGTLRASGSATALGTGAATLTLGGGTVELANDAAMSFGRNTTVSSNSTLKSDRLTSGAGVTQTLGTLSINGSTLNVDKGSNVSSGTAGITFGATTLTGNPTFDIGSGVQLQLGALNDNSAARTITKADAGTLVFGTAASSVVAGSNLVVNGGIAQVNIANALTSTNSYGVTVNATSGSTAAFNLNNVNQTIASLTFGGAGAAANAVNSVATGTGTLTLGGNVSYDATNNPGGATLTGLLALGGNRTFTIGDSSNTGAELTVGAQISGAFGIDKQGAGELVLTGKNSYSGTTTVTAGSLRAEGFATNLGSGSLTLAGGTLELAGDTGLNFGRNTTVTGLSTIVADRLTNGAGVQHTLGTLSIGGQSLTLSAGSHVTSGTAEVAFGATSITNSPLFTTNTGTALFLGAINDNAVARTITKNGAGTLNLTATPGAAITAGTNFVVWDGALNSNISNALTSTNSAAVTVQATAASGTAAFNLNNVNDTVSALTFGGATAGANSVNSVTTGIGTLTLGGNVTYVATNDPGGATISGNLAMGANRTFTIGDSANTTNELSISAAITGAGGLIKAGDGTMVLSGANRFTGKTTVQQGTLSVSSLNSVTGGNASSALGAPTTVANGTIDLGNGTTTGTLTYTGSGETTDRVINLAGSTGGGRINASGTGGVTFTSNLTAAAGSKTFTLGGTGTGTASGSFNGVISNGSGAVALAKEDAGTWILGGASANTYTGGTAVNAGTLVLDKSSGVAIPGALAINDGTVKLAGASQIASTAAVTFGNSGTPTLNLNGYSQTLATISSSNASSALQLGSPTTATTFALDSGTFAGAITGGANTTLSKGTTGSLTLSGDNSGFTGKVDISNGTLNANSDNSVNNAIVNIGTGATLAIGGGATISNANTLSLNGTGYGSAGALTNGGGTNTTARWNGNLLLTGNTTIQSGDNLLIVGEAPGYTSKMALGTNTITFNTPYVPAVVPNYDGDGEVIPNPAAGYILDATSILVNSAISGTGGLNKTGPGTLNLMPVINGSTFTGDTNIYQGKVIVDGQPDLPSINSTNIYVGNLASTGGVSADSVTLQMGQLGSTAANHMIGTYDFFTDGSSSSLTVYADGLFNMNNGSNGFTNLSLKGGHIDGNHTVNPDLSPLLTVTGGITTTASPQTAVIESGYLGMSNAGAFNINVAQYSSLTPAFVDLKIDQVVQNGIGYFGGTSGTSLYKSGSGLLLLTKSNTYAGVTDVTAGTLVIQNGGALGAAGTSEGDTNNGTIVRNNAQLQLQGGITVGSTTATSETLTLNGYGFGGSGGALRNDSGDNTYKGKILLAADSQISAAAGTTLTITNSSGVANSIINGTSAGKLLTFDTETSGTMTPHGAITVNGGISAFVGGIEKNGKGTLTFAGSNAYTGATNVNEGILKITHKNGLAGTGVAVDDGATLQFAGNLNSGTGGAVVGVDSHITGTGLGGIGAINNLSGTNEYAGAVTLDGPSLIASTAGSLTIQGGVTHNVGTNYALQVGGAGNIGFTGAVNTGTITTASTGSPFNYTKITGTGSTGTLEKIGSGTLTLGGGSGVTHNLDGITLTLGTIDVVTSGTTVMSGPVTSTNATNILSIAAGAKVQSYYAPGTTKTFTGQMAGGGIFEMDSLTNGTGGELVFDTSFTATNLTLVLNGGRLTLSGSTIDVGTIHITGNTILDFGLSTDTMLRSNTLIIDAGVTVTVENWTSYMDHWVALTSFYQDSGSGLTYGVQDRREGIPESQIVFQGLTSSWSTWVTPQGSFGYMDKEIRPTPEPATYGAMLLSATLGLFGWRRIRRQRAEKKK